MAFIIFRQHLLLDFAVVAAALVVSVHATNAKHIDNRRRLGIGLNQVTRNTPPLHNTNTKRTNQKQWNTVLQKSNSQSGSQVQYNTPALVHEEDHLQSIIGGEIDPKGDNPFLVSLGDGNESPSDGQYCAGTLIHTNVILTSANCVSCPPGEVELCSPGDFFASGWVEIGRYNLTDDTEAVGRVEVCDEECGGDCPDDVACTLRHPDFVVNGTLGGVWDDNDAALIFLPVPVRAIPTIALNTDPNVPDPWDVLTAIGWGITTINGTDVIPWPEVPHTVDLLYIPNEMCGDYTPESITENMMCAADDGKDTCFGDTGGPLFANTTSGLVQMGITSWGFSCAVKEYPGVYTRISAVYPWIESAICEQFPNDDVFCATTSEPTDGPTVPPITEPTDKPTKSPSRKPTDEPTNGPTVSPTPEPTREPTVTTIAPVITTSGPSDGPTASPITEPTRTPTVTTIAPIVVTSEPSDGPTVSPNPEPTVATLSPSPSSVSGSPTYKPTVDTPEPTAAPVDAGSTSSPTKTQGTKSSKSKSSKGGSKSSKAKSSKAKANKSQSGEQI